MAVRAVTIRLTDDESDYLEWVASKNRSYRNTIASHLLSAAIQNEMTQHREEYDAYRAANEKETEKDGERQ